MKISSIKGNSKKLPVGAMLKAGFTFLFVVGVMQIMALSGRASQDAAATHRKLQAVVEKKNEQNTKEIAGKIRANKPPPSPPSFHEVSSSSSQRQLLGADPDPLVRGGCVNTPGKTRLTSGTSGDSLVGWEAGLELKSDAGFCAAPSLRVLVQSAGAVSAFSRTFNSATQKVVLYAAAYLPQGATLQIVGTLVTSLGTSVVDLNFDTPNGDDWQSQSVEFSVVGGASLLSAGLLLVPSCISCAAYPLVDNVSITLCDSSVS